MEPWDGGCVGNVGVAGVTIPFRRSIIHPSEDAGWCCQVSLGSLLDFPSSEHEFLFYKDDKKMQSLDTWDCINDAFTQLK